MVRVPGINHLEVVKALEKAGFHIARQSKHIVMTDGCYVVTIPRHNPVNAFTLGTIVRGAGLSVDQFRNRL
jgi:predicted RNA binding protein YcfA (HicA-like mRNA interferase family)